MSTPRKVKTKTMGDGQRRVIGCSLALGILLVLTQLVALWPAVEDATIATPRAHTTTVLFGLAHVTPRPDVVLMAMVLLTGMLGAVAAAIGRFLYFAVRDELTARDAWSYLLRPLQGAGLALIVYAALRGGYLGSNDTSPVSPFGVAALSAFVGLFTRHAMSKLSQVFDTLFGDPTEVGKPRGGAGGGGGEPDIELVPDEPKPAGR